MRRALRLAVLAALVAAGPAYAQTTPSISVTPLARDGQVLISFDVAEAFTDELRAAVQAGLTTSFTYDVELRKSVPAWVDRTVDAARITATVRYDNLTRRYQVTLIQDGRVEETRVTDDEEEVRRWVTSFVRLPLFSTRRLEPRAEYYVRVRAETRPRNAWFFLPWDGGTASGMARFTFLP